MFSLCLWGPNIESYHLFSWPLGTSPFNPLLNKQTTEGPRPIGASCDVQKRRTRIIKQEKENRNNNHQKCCAAAGLSWPGLHLKVIGSVRCTRLSSQTRQECSHTDVRPLNLLRMWGSWVQVLQHVGGTPSISDPLKPWVPRPEDAALSSSPSGNYRASWATAPSDIRRPPTHNMTPSHKPAQMVFKTWCIQQLWGTLRVQIPPNWFVTLHEGDSNLVCVLRLAAILSPSAC